LIRELKSKNSSVLAMIKNHYYNGNDLCTEIISISDFINAYFGFKSENEEENAQIAANIFFEELSTISSLPQYASLKEMSKSGSTEPIKSISEQNIDHFVNNLFKEYRQNKFVVNKELIDAEFPKPLNNSNSQPDSWWSKLF
jgi:hypothetical protein